MSMKSPFRYFNSTIVLLLLLFFLTSVNNVVVATDDDADYMLRLFEAFTPKPPGWSNNAHFCKWNGVVCNETTSRVQIIKLPSMSLKGELPPDLHTLSDLTHLDLHNNSLTGSLPILTIIEALETVNLGHNNFTTIPDDNFQMITSLKTLNLSNNLNLMRWLFPINLLSYPMLHTLDLEATNMIGSLPDTSYWPPSLETLVLSHNNMSGPLPDSLGKSSIKCLKLNNQGVRNGFTGSIKVISSMKLLSQVWLNNNNLRGFIPDFSNSTHLFDMQLYSNSIYGLVPPSLMALSSLKNISLDNNYLEGPIPVFNKDVKATSKYNRFCRTDVGPCNPNVITLLQIIADFDVPTAYFDWQGNDPCKGWSFIECTRGKIISINLGNQQLSGTISPSFSNLKDLVNLTLSNNDLTGSIPESLTTLSQLRLLDVSNNSMSGKIPKFPSKVKLITKDNANLLGNGSASSNNATLLRTLWITGASVFGIVVAILIVIIRKHKSYLSLVQKKIFKKTTTLLDDNVEDFIKSYNLSVPKRYSYAEVKKITNSFRDKLGQGGYGVVYKGKLLDGREVAVKVIKESKGDGEEFINEVASISRTLHVNIVSLLGFCYEKNKRTLIYEFMPNGSLDKFIYKSGLVPFVAWIGIHCTKLSLVLLEGLNTYIKDVFHGSCI